MHAGIDSTAFLGESLSYHASSGAEVGLRDWNFRGPPSLGIGEVTRGSMASRSRDEAYPRLAGIRRCTSVADLAGIFLPDVAVAYWPRRSQPAIEAYLDAILARGALGSGGRWILDVEGTHAFPELPDLAGKETLCQDMAFLGLLCADLVGCTRVGVRIEVLNRAMCPRFHVDRVGLRLLCTYRGPGTEYLESPRIVRDDAGASVDRPAGGMSENVRGERIVRLPRAAVVLLKGDGWPGNEGRGAVHRSPAVNECEAKRVLLAIDPLD